MQKPLYGMGLAKIGSQIVVWIFASITGTANFMNFSGT